MTTSSVRRLTSLGAVGAVTLATALLAAGSAGAAAHRVAPDKAKIIGAQLVAVSVVPHSSEAWALGTQNTSTTVTRYAVKISGGHSTKESIQPTNEGQPSVIAAGSAKSIWVAGVAFTKGSSTEVPLIEHSTGGSFKVMKTKLPPGNIVGISASSASNAWVTGTRSDGTPLVAHWNGKKWSPVSIGGELNGLTFSSISTTSASNVWLLGSESAVPETAHLKGHKFVVSTLKPPTGATAQAIATGSAHSAWLVGYKTVTKGSTTTVEPYTAHSTGKSWKDVPAQSDGAHAYALAVGVSGNRAYLVGQSSNATSLKIQPLVERLAGGHWSKVSAAHKGGASFFSGVGVSSKVAVAVGQWHKGNVCTTPSHALAESLGSHANVIGVPALRWSPAQRHVTMTPDVPAC